MPDFTPIPQADLDAMRRPDHTIYSNVHRYRDVNCLLLAYQAALAEIKELKMDKLGITERDIAETQYAKPELER